MPKSAKSKRLTYKKRYASNSEGICASRKEYYRQNAGKVKEAYNEDAEKFKLQRKHMPPTQKSLKRHLR